MVSMPGNSDGRNMPASSFSGLPMATATPGCGENVTDSVAEQKVLDRASFQPRARSLWRTTASLWASGCSTTIRRNREACWRSGCNHRRERSLRPSRSRVRDPGASSATSPGSPLPGPCASCSPEPAVLFLSYPCSTPRPSSVAPRMRRTSRWLSPMPGVVQYALWRPERLRRPSPRQRGRRLRE